MTRLRYENIANDTVAVDLQNGYSVIAMCLFNKELSIYEVTLYIKDNKIELLDMIMSGIEIHADYKTVRPAVLKTVSDMFENNGLSHYIKRYAYMINCFEMGNELLEQEMTGEANEPDNL